jgi:hypothetical protein
MYKVDIKSRRPDAEPSNVKIATYQFTSENEAVEFAKQYNLYSQVKIAVMLEHDQDERATLLTAS